MTTTITPYRLGVAVALGTALVLLYGIGALGVIGSGGPEDLIYFGVLGVGVVGVLVARLRPRRMALALLATALAVVLAAGIALIAGWHHNEGASVGEILGLNAMFAAGFGLAAWLFQQAADHAVS